MSFSCTTPGGLFASDEFALGVDVLVGGWKSISHARAGRWSQESKGQTGSGSAESREK